MMDESPTAKIRRMNPEKDHDKIVKELSTTVFPWDIERALEFALYRTYAIPSISGLLSHTGKFEQEPQKRYDDTELLLAEVMENGLNSAPAHQAIERINAIHGQYSIRNEDFLYVLSTFIFEPIRWVKRYGWRSMTPLEEKAWFNYYSALGRRMNIHSIPSSIEAFEAYNVAFEKAHFAYSESNHRVACATRDLFLGFYLPKPLYGLGLPAFYAMLDRELLLALGFSEPKRNTVRVTKSLMQCRAWLIQKLPKRTKPVYITKRKRPSYPMGYAIAELGSLKGGA